MFPYYPMYPQPNQPMIPQQQPMSAQRQGMSFQDFVRQYQTNPQSLNPNFTGNPMRDAMAVMGQRGIDPGQMFPGMR